MNGTVSERYFYKSRTGNLDCVTSSSVGQPACTDPARSGVLDSYQWDGLDRIRQFDSYRAGGAVSSSYTHDAFDRTTSETENHGGSSTTTNFSFVGASDNVSTETQSGANTGARSYSYDAFNQLVGMSSGGQDYSYGRNVHGDISQLVNSSGNATVSYGYKAYGADDNGLSRGDSSTGPGQTNPFRFSGKRFDTGSGTIDMGARRYGPDIGRFLQQDYYGGALGDLDLAADPLTANRYGFAGGNPINFVELDGHSFGDIVRHPLRTAKKVAKFKSDVETGIAKQAISTGKGLYETSKFVDRHDPLHNPTGFIDQYRSDARTASAIAHHPVAAAKAVGKSVAEPYRHGPAGERVGRGIFDVGSLAIAATKAGKLGTAARAAEEGLGDAATTTARIHGNSASSPATSYLYRLEDAATGDYLKTGISKNPDSRYSQTFLRGKRMRILQEGSRREMLNLERFIIERDPGPLNHDRWAGRYANDVPGGG